MKTRARILVYVNAVIVVAVALYFFALPTAILVQGISDPGLRSGEMPRSMFRLHRSLSQKIEP